MERRKAAMNQALRTSYEAYMEAFYQDLNHFYSGLAALQMGMIFLDLFNLSKNARAILGLSIREGLPKWLAGVETNPWERGNRWVLQMALTSDADETTLVALWDGKEEGDAPGGMAHMVQLARNAGRVHVAIIDARRLLA